MWRRRPPPWPRLLALILAAATQRPASATNRKCWWGNYTAERCCGPPADESCFGPESGFTYVACCELGGTLVDLGLREEMLAQPRLPVWPEGRHYCPDYLARRYFLPADYRQRRGPPGDYVDDACAHQAPVYALAYGVARQAQMMRVVEVGGGSGRWAHRLLRYGCNVTLLDRDGPNLKAATNYLGNAVRLGVLHAGRWAASPWDIDGPEMPQLPPGWTSKNFARGRPAPKSRMLVIAADVVEHLERPHNLLGFVGGLLSSGDAGAVILSTPDRESVYDRRFHSGPPHNPAHVREWNATEFRLLLTCARLPLAALLEVEGTLVALLAHREMAESLVLEEAWTSRAANSFLPSCKELKGERCKGNYTGGVKLSMEAANHLYQTEFSMNGGRPRVYWRHLA